MSWSPVQTSTPTQVGNGNTSVSTTFSSAVTAGNLVVVGFNGYQSSPSGVTDSAGNTYTRAAYKSNSGWASIYYSVVTTGGTLTITGASNAGTLLSIAAQEWSFAAGATISVDGSAGNSGTGTSGTVGPLTVSGNDLAVAMIVNTGVNSAAYTAGSGFTMGYDDHNGGQPIGCIYAANVTSAQTPTWTISSSVPWTVAAATFQEIAKLTPPGSIATPITQARRRFNGRAGVQALIVGPGTPFYFGRSVVSLISQPRRRTSGRVFLQAFRPPTGSAVYYNGIDALAATEAWWNATSSATSLTSDGKLWYLEAPETTQLPYATFALASEQIDTWTTGFPLYRASVEIKLHANTPAAARTAALNLRLAFKQAPLEVNGQTVLHVLPDGDSVDIGEGLAPNGRDCWIATERFDIPWTGTLGSLGTGGPYNGTDALAATEAWWNATTAISSLTSDGKLWYLEAPETTQLPYATYFLVAEPVDTWTTGFALYRASLQINLHASTPGAAKTLALTLRTAFTLSPLTINSLPVLHVLPDGDTLQIGEGLAPSGRDCWVACETFDIPWTQ